MIRTIKELKEIIKELPRELSGEVICGAASWRISGAVVMLALVKHTHVSITTLLL